MKAKTEIYNLLDLKKYGLNPLHWFISDCNRNTPEIAHFTHIDDPELKLKAVFTKESEATEYRITDLMLSH